jgi:DNA-3-methyladenine glycosylase II
MAQQVSTSVARRIAARVKEAYPTLGTTSPCVQLDVLTLKQAGLPTSRAECCAAIARQSSDLLNQVAAGRPWDETLRTIKGVGPWTIAVFRIMVLREPDILPLGDIGLQRAVARLYADVPSLSAIAEKWRPYRSAACWHLWKSLGNTQLG